MNRALVTGASRGIGSVFYLMFALRHGLEPRISQQLVTLTLWTVAISIVTHGITAQPLMRRYIGSRSAGRGIN